jgi:hypothetical protein
MSREVTDEECLRVSGDPHEFLRMIGRMPLDDGSGGSKEEDGDTGERRTRHGSLKLYGPPRNRPPAAAVSGS